MRRRRKPARGTIRDDRSGTLVDDIFFRIWHGPFFDDFETLPRTIVKEVPSSDPTEVSIMEDRSPRSSSGRCARHPDHLDICRLEYIDCLICNFGTDDGDLFGHHDYPEFVLASEALQYALIEANFQGTRFAETRVELDGPGPSYLKKIRAVCFDGRDIRRAYVVEPPEENRCVHCGYAPVVCAICPHIDDACPRCGKTTWSGDYLFDEDEQVAEATLQKETAVNEESGEVLDLRFWDGSDFVGEYPGPNIVTGRVVDLLLERNITNLAIQPRICYVGNSEPDEYAPLRSRLYSKHLSAAAGKEHRSPRVR